MRKLSKKISMLMVLAMLVSMFSGIVSASAASKWSFYDRTADEVVEVKDTYVMEKDQYANFDLYCEGEEADADTYSYYWESSDPDVVFVDKTNGRLRADKYGKAEAGDKAMISVYIDNKTTEKNENAKRSFYIEIAADEVVEEVEYKIATNIVPDEVYYVGEKYELEAVVTADGEEIEAEVVFSIDDVAIKEFAPTKDGEYTIVATATIDDEVVKTEKFVVTVETVGLVAAKQTTFNTVALTFDTAAAAEAVVKDNSKLESVYYLGDNEIQAFVNTIKVDEKNAAVVNVTLYNNIEKNVTYKFTYAGKSASIVGVDVNQYASMSIKTKAVAAWSWEDVEVNLYNATGVLVKTVDSGFTLEAVNDGAYSVNGDQIYFHDKDKVANVKATFWMGYDNNGNKIADLTAIGAISSYDANATTTSMIKEWSITGNSWEFSANNSAKLVIGESTQLFFKVDKFDRTGKQLPSPIFNGSASAFENYNIRFVSSNENVVLVDNTVNFGEFHPVGVGSAQIVVYRYTYDFDATKEVMGVFNVNVAASRVLTAANPAVTNRNLSTSADAYTLLMPKAVDQLGKAMDGNTQYFLKLVNVPQGVTVTAEGNNCSYPLSKVDGDGQLIAIKGGTGESGWAEHFKLTASTAPGYNGATSAQIQITIKHGYDAPITKVVPISVKAPDGWGWSYSLDSVKGSIDMNLLNDRNNGDLSRFATTVSMNIYDSQGYLVQKIDDELTYGAATTGGYYWVVKKNGLDASGEFAGRTLSTVSSTAGIISKIYPATYTVTLYKNNNGVAQYLTSKNIVVSDSTPAISAVKISNKVTASDTATLIATLKGNNFLFNRNGKAIDSADITIENVISQVIVNTNRVSVSKIYVSQNYGAGKFVEEVNVYTTFEIAP